jgi:hypothetical protein
MLIHQSSERSQILSQVHVILNYFTRPRNPSAIIEIM